MLMTLLGTVFISCIAGCCLLEPDKNKLDNYNELKSVTGEGIIISKHIQLSVNQSNEHILMVAPSGSGKSRRFIMPNIPKLNNCSLIITDPSTEIEHTCKTNKKAFILNPFNDNCIGYDPVFACKSEFEVRKIARVILENGMSDSTDSHQKEWVDMGVPLLTSYMLLNYYTHKYPFNELVKRICTESIFPTKQNPNDCILKEILDSGIECAITELEMFLQVMGAPQTLSSIRIVMNSCLQMFMDDNLQKLFNKPCIDLSMFRKEECILYIQIPERHSTYYKPLTATFLTQFIDTILDNKGLQIYMILDEFANIGHIPDICKLLSTARKHNLSIVATIQNLTQLHRIYGDTDGKELPELFKTTIICAGLKDSAEYISKLIGSKKTKKGTEPKMTESDIRTIDKNKAIIICDNKKPVVDELNEIFI